MGALVRFGSFTDIIQNLNFTLDTGLSLKLLENLDLLDDHLKEEVWYTVIRS